MTGKRSLTGTIGKQLSKLRPAKRQAVAEPTAFQGNRDVSRLSCGSCQESPVLPESLPALWHTRSQTLAGRVCAQTSQGLTKHGKWQPSTHPALLSVLMHDTEMEEQMYQSQRQTFYLPEMYQSLATVTGQLLRHLLNFCLGIYLWEVGKAASSPVTGAFPPKVVRLPNVLSPRTPTGVSAVPEY